MLSLKATVCWSPSTPRSHLNCCWRARPATWCVSSRMRARQQALPSRTAFMSHCSRRRGLISSQCWPAQGDYIRSETLASLLDVGTSEEGSYTMEAELEDGVVVVGVRRVM